MKNFYEYPESMLKFTLDPFQHFFLKNLANRRLYLEGSIASRAEADYFGDDTMLVGDVIKHIIQYNRDDECIDPSDRKPIMLYINSPGGDVTEGFGLVSTIAASKTPVYTINIGQWCSMAFLIGITGHRRFSLPNMLFLMHDGSNVIFGTSNKVKDTAKFNERFEDEVIKRHVLTHSRISEKEYDDHSRVEWYMLPEDALKYGFIDGIVTDLSLIL